MTYKRLLTSQELRLWVAQVILPATFVGIVLMQDPDIQEKAVKIKNKVKNKFKKN